MPQYELTELTNRVEVHAAYIAYKATLLRRSYEYSILIVEA
jgi:hypothetical protein